MFHKDDNLYITTNGGNELNFIAFLDDCDTTYDLKDQQLPFSPTSFVNDSMMLRVTQKVKLSFNVFSENRYECRNNYKNLLVLIENTKPRYFKIYSQYAPDMRNVTGYFKVKFKGLPLRQDEVTLHLTNFSYSINKEIGYIQMPWNSDEKDPANLTDDNNPDSYYSQETKLVPLSFKINIEGRILLPFEETIRLNKLSSKKEEVAPPPSPPKEEPKIDNSTEQLLKDMKADKLPKDQQEKLAASLKALEGAGYVKKRPDGTSYVDSESLSRDYNDARTRVTANNYTNPAQKSADLQTIRTIEDSSVGFNQVTTQYQSSLDLSKIMKK